MLARGESIKAGTLRRMTLCADDYGLAPGVDSAIRDLVVQGRLNATSVMVTAPTCSRAEALSLSILNAGGKRVSIGLHVTLTGPLSPLTRDFAPLNEGKFLPVAEMLKLALLRRLDRAALAREVEAQLSAFAALFGAPPDFVDGHQHVHLFPQVREAVLAATQRLAPQAWVRQCGTAAPPRLGDPKGALIGWLSRRFRARARRLGLATNPAFAGTYTFRADADIARIFPTFLDGLPDGALIMCHPGHVDEELKRLDPLTDLREKEYAYFVGRAFAELLAVKGISLV